VTNKRLGGIITLAFHYPDALEGKEYRIVIEHEDGMIIYDNREFSSFNLVHDGSLSFEASAFKTGEYTLKIHDYAIGADISAQEYRFLVVD